MVAVEVLEFLGRFQVHSPLFEQRLGVRIHFAGRIGIERLGRVVGGGAARKQARRQRQASCTQQRRKRLGAPRLPEMPLRLVPVVVVRF